jgi:hypothetical protein
MTTTERLPVYPRLPRILDLDRQTYVKDMEVIAHFEPGKLRGRKMQMMAIGSPNLEPAPVAEWFPEGANIGT